MATKPLDKDLLPSLLQQNPSPVEKESQDRRLRAREQVDRIMQVFLQLLPSNYVSQVSGPFYTLQFQAAAEQIAEFQISAQEVMADSVYDYTRPEFLYQILGAMVFPDATSDGYPTMEGDLSFRTFLKRMVELLLKGATKESVLEGLQLLSDADFEVIERAIEARKLGGISAWKEKDQFTLEINVSKQTGSQYRFPEEPFILQENARIVFRALAPAHTLYDYRHLFKEAFGSVFSDENDDGDPNMSFNMQSYYYEDNRRFWHGQKSITGTQGKTWTDRGLFSDVTRDFSSVQIGANLVVTSGPNSLAAVTTDEGWVGRFRVKEVRTFPVGDDATARKYTTSPTNLSGKAVISNGAIQDNAQNFALAVEGETLTFLDGPNAGTYRLKTLLGNNGGAIGVAVGPGTRVFPAPCLLRLETRMHVATTGQAYQVDVDRLGVQVPRQVSGEVVTYIKPGGRILFTRRGPLVKLWGDNTPATKQDVSVTVNGVGVNFALNPFNGQVTLANAVALNLDGSPTVPVTVSYYWLASPVMPLLLNTPGLTLNKMVPFQRQPGSLSSPTNYLGGGMSSRFPMGVVLGPQRNRRKPLYIGHRYQGFERGYSALLNSPTTLRLNNPPGRATLPGFYKLTTPVTSAFDGTVPPVPKWDLAGTDYGHVDVNLGTYTVIDANAGDYDPANPQGVVYTQAADLSFPAALYVVGRFLLPADTALFQTAAEKASAPPGKADLTRTPDGVFTGVGFGIHDNRRLYLVGALLVNGLEHVGLLADARKPHLVESWVIGPKAVLTIKSASTANASTVNLPVDFAVGSRFQILTGTQAGVYTVTKLLAHTDGTSDMSVTPNFPADFNLFGNNYPEAISETIWTAKPTTYRLTVGTATHKAELRLAGKTTALVASLDGTAPEYPQPADTSLLLSTSGKGQVFWGSLSQKAISRTTWSFFQYGLVPDSTGISGYSVAIASEMTTVPEKDPKYEWFKTQDFGLSTVDSSGLKVLLKSTTASETLDYSFGYSRIEPFLIPKTIADVRAKFSLETGVLGAGDAELVFTDTAQEIRLATLLYEEGLLPGAYRQLLRMPQVSLAGLLNPEVQGWARLANFTLTPAHSGPDLVTVQDDEHQGGYTATLTPVGAVDPGSRVIEARFAVKSYTANGNGDTGIRFGGDFGLAGNYRFVGVSLEDTGTPKLRLITANQTVVQKYTFNWADKAVHTYRIVADVVGAVVALYVDDVLMVPSKATNLFNGGTGNVVAKFGAFGDAANGALDPLLMANVEWRALSYSGLPPATAKRTFGIYLGGSKDDIDSWEIPRTDTSTAKNSVQNGPVIQQVDWRVATNVRLLRDPAWGVTLYLPDLGLPPFYQAENGTPGKGFITETTEPSAGWINVETSKLPPRVSTFGQVLFGSLDARSVSQQRWDRVRYRLAANRTEDLTAPQGMVLNRYNVISSGERSRDVTPEMVSIQTLDRTRVSLLPAHMYAQSVYKIVDGTQIYTSNDWVFDSVSQTITLQPDANGDARQFSTEHAAVTVVFIPGKTVTDTYLKGQPLLDSVTLLNEGTPPVPKGQIGKATSAPVQGSKLNTQAGVPDNDVDNAQPDPLKVVTWTDPAGTLYNALTFMQVDNGGETGLIAGLGEGLLPAGDSGWFPAEGAEKVYSPSGGGAALGGVGASAGLFDTGTVVGQPGGAHAIGLSGSLFSEMTFKPPYQGFPQKGGMPGGILLASGGNFVGPVVDVNGKIIPGKFKALGGTLGPGTSVLFPNYPSLEAYRGQGAGAIHKETTWHMSFHAVLLQVGNPEHALQETLSLNLADSIPPTEPYTWVLNPNGVAKPAGSALLTLDGSGNFSHVGPWGGKAALSAAAGTNITQKSLLAGGSVTLINGVHDPLMGIVLQGGAPLPQGSKTVVVL